MQNYRAIPLLDDSSNRRNHWRTIEIAGVDYRRVKDWLESNPRFADPRKARYPRYEIFRTAGHRAWRIRLTVKVLARLQREVDVDVIYIGS